MAGALRAAGLALDGRPVGPEGKVELNVDVTARSKGRSEIRRLDLRSGVLEATVRGGVEMPAGDGAIRVEAAVPGLRELLAALPGTPEPGAAPTGRVDLAADIGLAQGGRRIETELAVTGQGIAGLPGRADAVIGAAPRLRSHILFEAEKAVRSSGLSLDAAALTIRGDPGLDLRNQALSGTVTLEVADLAKLEPVLNQPAAGTLRLDLALAGTASAPDLRLQGTGQALVLAGRAIDTLRLDATAAGPLEAAGGELALVATQAQDEVALRTDYRREGTAVRLDRLSLTAPGTELNGGLVIDTAPLAVDGELTGKVANLARLRSWHRQELAGRIGLTAELTSPEGRQNATVKMDAAGLRGGFGSLNRATVTADLVDALGRMGLDATLGLTGFAAPGVTVADAQLQAQGDLADLELTVSARGSQAGRPFEVRTSATAELAERAKRVVVSELGGNLMGHALSLGGPARVETDGSAIDLDGLDLRLGATSLRADLGIGTSGAPADLAMPQRALRGSLAADVDLGMINDLAVLDGQRLGGRLTADLTLAGRVGRPVVRGTTSLSDGLVEDQISGAYLRDITLQLVGDGDRLVIERLTANDRENGRVTGKGEVGLASAGGPSADLGLEFTSLRVLNNDLGQARISGDLSITRGGQGLRISNRRLVVDRADLLIPEGGGVTVPELAVEEVYRPGQAPQPPASEEADGVALPIRLDLTVDIPGQLFVRGRGLDSEWGGGLKITGTAAEPSIVGEIKFRRGSLDLLAKRFAIEEGIITFTGDTPPIPYLNLTAVTDAEEVEAKIVIAGPATKPKLTLLSEPELPQDEVLSRILFGKSVSTITPMQGLRLAVAVRELQGGESGAFDRLRAGLGVDTLDVGSEETASGESETTVRAGKYLSDKVYLEVQRGATSESGKARVEVEVTPHVSVETEASENAQTGVGLLWRYDY